jgi:hypothetical protein
MRIVALLSLVVAAAACQPIAGQGQGPAPAGATSARPLDRAGMAAQPAFAEELVDGRVFRAISLAQLLRTSNLQDAKPAPGVPGAGHYYLGARPEARPGESLARQLQSGNHALVYRFPAPLAEGERLIVSSVLATELGAPPAEPGRVAAWLLPLRRAWASDCALVTVYSYQGPRFAPSEGYDPAATRDEASILRLAGWPLAYTSASKREALYVYASGLAIKVRWQLPDLGAQDVPISAAEAIARHDRAMREPAFRSTEEQTGRDHFLGLPYADAYPASTWDHWNNFDDDTPVFDFPNPTPWAAEFLYEYAGKPVWTINVPTGGGFGSGFVDALTGEVIRFHRVTRRHVIGPHVPPPFPAASAPSW